MAGASARPAEPVRSPVERIAAVRVDANGDGEPDRLGDTVTVAGRASSSSRTLNRDYTFLFMEDGSAGIALFSFEPAREVATGDSIVVTGVVQQYRGLSQLHVVALRLIPGPRRVPDVVVLDEPYHDLERFEGRLVEVRGRIKGRSRTEQGEFVLVGSESTLDGLQVFVANAHSSPPDLARLRVGDRVVLRGLLSQHDFEPPYATHYQIFPRSADDIRIEGLPGEHLQTVLRWGAALLAAVVLLLLLMRVQVRRRTRQLKETARRFHALIENAYEMIFVLGADGTVTFASGGVERVLGWNAAERVGGSAFDIVHPDDLERVHATFQELGATPGSRRAIEFRARHRDGSYRTLDAVAQNLLHDPATAGIVVNSRDATERKSLEQELLQTRKLEAIGRVAGGIAHDFNNLMTVVRGHTELLLSGPREDESVLAGLAEIDEAAERASELTGQLLAFSRKQVLRPSVVDPVELLRRMEKLLRRLIGEDIHIEFRVAEGVGNVTADPTQLEQVLMNLAVNARDAMPDGGTLLFGLENARVEPSSPLRTDVPAGEYVVVTVQDSGTGIAPDVIEHIFDPFFTTKDGVGTGLGLATVYGIVRQSGGHIGVKSDASGTTFRIHLPRTDAPVAPLTARAEKPAAAPVGGNGGRGGTILLVEDERAVRAMATRILERGGYRVLEAANGVEALDVLSSALETPPDLVVTDVVMPLMGGRELAEHIARLRPGTPLLFMSGYTDDVVLQRGIIADGRQFLAKPYSPDELLERVATLMPARAEAASA
ncbi:MAG TPA: response regulator, partial [Longimicrobiales bacterium]